MKKRIFALALALTLLAGLLAAFAVHRFRRLAEQG